MSGDHYSGTAMLVHDLSKSREPARLSSHV